MMLHDVHCHFFSARFFETLGRERHGCQADIAADRIAGELGWDAPGSSEELADRWAGELTRHRVSRAALIASVPGDEGSVAAALARHPGRFVGFFREALMAAEVCPTIHLDTSSSNGWVKYLPGLTLAEVFRRALAVAGPDRLIFGTDSSLFPRGWHRVICGAQQTALDELGVEAGVCAKIFSGNFERVFPQTRA